LRTLSLQQCLRRLDRTTKKLRFDRRPAVVLVACPEVRPTALMAIRSLGRKGVPVVAVAAERHPPSFYSKFSTVCVRCPDQKRSVDDFLEFLARLGKRITPRPTLEFCSDYDTVIVCGNAERLRPVYDCPFLSERALMLSIDKWQMINAAKNAGFDIPETYLLKDRSDLESASGCALPAIVKPLGRFNWDGTQVRNRGLFIRVFNRKAVRARTRDELIACLETVLEHGLTVLVQEEVPGPSDALYLLCLYADRRSNVVAEFHGKKIRQMPSDFGSGTLTAPAPPNPYLSEIARTFVKNAEFHGIAVFEWKLDPRDAKYKFTEVNPRCWTWTILSDAVGVNLPYVQYLEMTGQEIPLLAQQERDVKCVDLVLDWTYFWNYRKSDHTGRTLSLGEWVRSLRGEREFAYFSRGDRVPGLVNLCSVLGELTGRAFRKLGRTVRRSTAQQAAFTRDEV